MAMHFEELKSKQRDIREGFPEELGLRVHRAISWFGRAEKEQGDNDAAFLFLWISFNAAYAHEEEDSGFMKLGDRKQFIWFIEKMVALDEGGRLHDALWIKFRGPVAKLMQNRFVYRPFWLNQNGLPGGENWSKKWKRSAEHFVRDMADKHTARVLREVFDRLYVLRCQMVHGGTTWDSNVNRDQVMDGAAILGTIVPVMIDLMMDNPEADWGKPFYPVISGATSGTKQASPKHS